MIRAFQWNTVWLDTHENVTKIDQDAAQHPTLSRYIQEHRITSDTGDIDHDFRLLSNANL